MPLPDKLTYDAKYHPAMEMKTEAEAVAYFAECVEHTMRVAKVDRDEAEDIERQNIGYFAGYYDHETRRRIERLFKCEHPILGSIEKNGEPTPIAALAAGMLWMHRSALRGKR